MSMLKKLDYADAPAEARAVMDDIKATRNVADVNNVWKVLANDPRQMKQFWEEIKSVMAPGKLDALTKEMIYVAVSITNSCDYCIHSHSASARKQGMSDEMFAELVAVVALANKGNRIASGYQVEVDEQFKRFP
jgi:AhpD family alkylhydroperoxidase